MQAIHLAHKPDSATLHRLLLAVLAKQIAGLVNLSVFSNVLRFVVLTTLLLFTLLLLLFPTHCPCIGVA